MNPVIIVFAIATGYVAVYVLLMKLASHLLE